LNYTEEIMCEFAFQIQDNVVYEFTKSKRIMCFPFCLYLIKHCTTKNDVWMET